MMEIATVEQNFQALNVAKPSRRRSRILISQLSTTSWQAALGLTGKLMSQTSKSSTDPTSNELLQQIKELNKDVDTSIQFIRGVNDIVCATIPVIFAIVLIAVYNVAAIFTGMKYLESCPLEQRIPVFLLVAGCFGLLKTLHVLSTNLRLRKHSSFTSDKTILDRDQRSAEIVDVALNLFLVGWQMAGMYWTFSIWYPRFEAPLHQPNEWCSDHVYLFAVVHLGLFGGLAFMVIFFYLCLVAYYKYTSQDLTF